MSRYGRTPEGSWIAENPPKAVALCCQGEKVQVDVLPRALSPRFARYYRDPNGVEFRDLMKAYGIRFDVIVNGKVCGSSHYSAWWLLG